MVDPRRLELLLELSRLGSMREVSEAMGITTSTVSQQIAVLAREANRPRRLTCSPRTRPACSVAAWSASLSVRVEPGDAVRCGALP